MLLVRVTPASLHAYGRAHADLEHPARAPYGLDQSPHALGNAPCVGIVFPHNRPGLRLHRFSDRADDLLMLRTRRSTHRVIDRTELERRRQLNRKVQPQEHRLEPRDQEAGAGHAEDGFALQHPNALGHRADLQSRRPRSQSVLHRVRDRVSARARELEFLARRSDLAQHFANDRHQIERHELWPATAKREVECFASQWKPCLSHRVLVGVGREGRRGLPGEHGPNIGSHSHYFKSETDTRSKSRTSTPVPRSRSRLTY